MKIPQRNQGLARVGLGVTNIPFISKRQREQLKRGKKLDAAAEKALLEEINSYTQTFTLVKRKDPL